jgi:hypothetical protein
MLSDEENRTEHREVSPAGSQVSHVPEGRSEVARLRQLIAAEYEAAVRGMTGLAQGTAKHAFIDARMNRVWHYGEQLATHVGEAEATRQVCELYVETIG